MELEHVLSNWERIRTKLLEAIDKFNDEDLTYKPFEASWSVGEIMLHIAQEEEGEIRYGVTQELTAWPSEYHTEDYPTVESIRSLLAEVHTRTEEYLRTLEDRDLDETIETPWGAKTKLSDSIGHVMEHEVHHRGELSLILGLLGREGVDA